MNKLRRNFFYKTTFFLLFAVVQIKGLAQGGAPKNDSLKYPITDRRTDFFSNTQKNGLDLKRPANITDSIVYDPKTKQYYIIEKVGSFYYRKPTALTSDEFFKLMAKKQETDYFQKRSKVIGSLNHGLKRPKLNWHKNLVHRLFGTGPSGLPKVEIRPQGNVNIITGYQGQRIQNPTLPERAQRNGGFDFDMNYQFNMNASIGEFLKFPISQNSLANFDFENQLKLDYQGQGDGIIKQFQAGNISFPARTSLIPGANQIFGLKTQLQFGKLFATFVIADQKSQRATQQLQGGAAAQRFEVRADDYEENRHFLVSQYFRNNYKTALQNIPIINSPIQVRRVEVWVTNRNGTTTETRDIVGLMDIAEPAPFISYPGGVGGTFPRNDANGLYSLLLNQADIRNPASVTSKLNFLGLKPVQDYEKVFARKLRQDEYYFNPKLGFISLNQPLRDDEVMGVALEYSVNGRVYKVGEFSQDVPPDSARGISNILFLKLLKATSARTNLPIWDLMMKNVYAVGYGTLQKQDFRLDVLYSEPSLGEKNYLPDVDVSKQLPLLNLLNLDNLNNQNDPQADGRFDYVDSITVIPQYSRIVFPVLEPFGHDLDYVFTGVDAPQKRAKYLYYPLYDTIKAIAQLYPNLNRFILRGYSKSTGGAEYNIGFNIPRGSVTISAGGQLLQENIDYTIDYDLGNVKIINQGVLNSGLPVNINYENNGGGFLGQQRNYMALRLDYQANKHLALGSTFVQLGERPFFRKMQFNEDPIRNKMIGLDFNYQNTSKRLTRWLDKLPFYSTTTASTITASGEVAAMLPGHPPQIGKGSESRAFLDDFEGARTSYDLKFPFNVWNLASTPYSATDPNGNTIVPNSNVINNLAYDNERAKLAWYQIEQNLQDRRSNSNPMKNIPGFLDSISDFRTRLVTQNEVFPNRTTNFGENLLPTFDLAFYPNERGQYNYDASTTNVNADGSLKLPKNKWGGIMRSIDQPDFETANFEFLEFWVQDPFLNTPSSNGGQLYFNLGNVSEDVLRDGRRFYENGLNTPSIPAAVDTTRWSRIPLNPIQVTNAFSNNPTDRPFQDVGFDGMNDTQEDSARANYLGALQTNFGVNSQAYLKAKADPSNDNYKWYRNTDYDNTNAGILTRYKNINNAQGNSPTSSSNSEFSEAYTLYPDAEELNRDNTMNETEEYFQYKVDLKPNMQIGSIQYLVDKRTTTVKLPNDQNKTVNWYLFRIPLREYYSKVGSIPDFKSIRFMRMFLHNFEEPVVARFARLELVRNQWRQFNNDLRNDGVYASLPNSALTKFSTGAINVEENDKRSPVNYLSPCDVVREQFVSNNTNLLENEQSMSLVFRRLLAKDSRAVFKTLNYDINQYKQLALYVHAESAAPPAIAIPNKKLVAVVRLGNDFINNFYEVRIPLTTTAPNSNYSAAGGDCKIIWPDENKLDFDLDILRNIKIERNKSGSSVLAKFSKQIGDKTFSVMGNPSLGEVRGILLGVQNDDDDAAFDGEVWFNELRLKGLSEKPGYAATGRVNINLADLGTLNIAATMHTIGFGNLEQRVNERYRDNFLQFDASANLELGKLTPKKWGLSIPTFASYSSTTSSPQYDPYDKDLNFKDKVSSLPKDQRDSAKAAAIEQTVIKTVSFNNVRKNKMNGKKPKVYDVSNFDASYAINKTERKSPLVEQDDITKYTGALGYSYNPQPKPWEPFKNTKSKFLKNKWMSIIKDFNINPVPSLFSFRADINRQFGVFRPRNVGVSGYKVPEAYNKFFTFDRRYDLRWEITKALNIDFAAQNNARVDEPFGRIDSKVKKDSVQKNFWKGGRNTLYNQRASANYTLPISKIPLLDFTKVDLKYQVTYDWIGASRLAIDLGNIIENKVQRGVTGELDFTRLYGKSKFLRKLDQPKSAFVNAPATNSGLATAKFKDTIGLKGKALRQAKKFNKKLLAKLNKTPKTEKALPLVVRGIGKLATSLKNIRLSFNEDMGTRLPGFMDSTQYLGNNWKSLSPGAGFVFGLQPDTNWLNNAGKRNLISKNPIFNELFTQQINQTIDLTARIEPFKDFTIDVNVTKSFSKSYNELFKDSGGTFTGNYKHLGPYASGAFSVSYVGVKTLFSKFDPNQTSEIFNRFQDYRKVLSTRLGQKYPLYNQLGVTNPVQSDGYYYGYNRYATDVLIPAFVAAYTGQDPNQVSLLKQENKNIRSNPFSGFIPKPNWGFTYTGLSTIPAVQKIFTNISISHKYNSTLGMNNFNSALFYADTFGVNYPTFYDTVSNNLVPYFFVPNITLSERFEPLISIDLQFVNRLNVNFDYRKSREVSLSLIDYQVSEIRSTQYGLRVDWMKQGKPNKNKKVKILGKNFDLNNDIRFQLDWSLRDDATSNSKLDQSNSFVTGGQKVMRLAPSVDYTLNKRVNLRFFYDRTKVIPNLPSASPITTTRAGLEVRVSLAE
jgi:cell surface protein SprA